MALIERIATANADPQTSGGLLVVVEDGFSKEFEKLAKDNGLELSPIGWTTDRGDKLVEVI